MSGYVDLVLQPGETVRGTGRLHWIIYLPGVAFLAFALAGVSTLLLEPESTRVFKELVFAAGFAGTAQLLGAVVRQISTEIAVTDTRVLLKTGLIARHTVEMNKSQIESIDVDQDLFGRIFNYGTVVVRGTGSGLEPLGSIASPLALRNCISAS